MSSIVLKSSCLESSGVRTLRRSNTLAKALRVDSVFPPASACVSLLLCLCLLSMRKLLLLLLVVDEKEKPSFQIDDDDDDDSVVVSVVVVVKSSSMREEEVVCSYMSQIKKDHYHAYSQDIDFVVWSYKKKEKILLQFFSVVLEKMKEKIGEDTYVRTKWCLSVQIFFATKQEENKNNSRHNVLCYV